MTRTELEGEIMDMKEVVSSNIKAVGFEPKNLELKTGTLQVQFVGGGMYQYLEVPKELYESLMKAESKGKFMNANISRKFKYQRVPPVEKQIDTEAPKQ